MGLTPDPTVTSIVQAAESRVAPLVNRVVGFAAAPLSNVPNSAGESALGDIIADAERASTGAQFAFINPGAIRAAIEGGDILWGELFTAQPFGNTLSTMKLRGAQIKDLLEEQWLHQSSARILQVSGLAYAWDNSAPVSERIIEIKDAASGQPLNPSALYTVSCNSFLAAGGDNFTTFTQGQERTTGALDLDALVEWVKQRTPLRPGPGSRITRLH